MECQPGCPQSGLGVEWEVEWAGLVGLRVVGASLVAVTEAI